MMEAGLEPELLCSGRDVLIQGLLWYFVIDKRKRELDDMSKGPDALGKFLFILRKKICHQFPETSASGDF